MKSDLDSFETLLSQLTFEFFGSGQHKTTADKLFSQPDGMLLDIRSQEEVDALALSFARDLTVLHIPTDQIPQRLGEIPTDRPVAIFCVAGIRAAIVYAYLRLKGHTQVRILVDSLEDLVKQAKPGKLWKRSQERGGAS